MTNPNERSFTWKSLQIIARICCTAWFDLKAYGLENVPKTGGVLRAANHQSYLDPVVVAVLLRRPVSYMAKSELFVNPFMGWLIRTLHAFPVRQGRGDVGALKETIKRLRDGYAMNIYPEGSRTEDGKIAPLLKGIALVIRKSGVPVVPVAIAGSFEAWPKGHTIFHASPVRVVYGQPMNLADLDEDEIIKRLNAAIRELFVQAVEKLNRTKLA
jgi:1-acyl-sn-glycerol-3-phosphate acyltransferase